MGSRPIRRGGGGKRRDKNEPEIIQALERIGAKVFQITGTGVPDILVHFQGRWQPLEVKSQGGKLTEAQAKEFMETPFPIVRTVDQAIAHFLMRPRA